MLSLSALDAALDAFAEHGYAVVVTDGRGTPGRGPAWERQVWGDLAGPVLDDQVAASREIVPWTGTPRRLADIDHQGVFAVDHDLAQDDIAQIQD